MLDLLIFHPSLAHEQGIPIMREIMAWSEGVRWGFEVNHGSDIKDFIRQETGMQTIVAADVSHVQGFATCYLRDSDQVLDDNFRYIFGENAIVSEAIPMKQVFREISLDGLHSLDLSELGGVVLRGSHELATGLADFYETDLLLDQLDELS